MCRTNDHCQSLSTCRRQMVSVIRIACGQTTVNKWALLYNPYKWYGPQTPLKTFKKIPPKFHDKAVQSNILWLNKKINQHINKVTLHFTFMRRAQNADTHALKQPRLPQNISPVCSSFVLVIASDMHLESQSEKRAKNVDLHTAKNIQIQPTLFRYF